MKTSVAVTRSRYLTRRLGTAALAWILTSGLLLIAVAEAPATSAPALQPPPPDSLNTTAGGVAGLARALTIAPILVTAVAGGFEFSGLDPPPLPLPTEDRTGPCPGGGTASIACAADDRTVLLITLSACTVSTPEGPLTYEGTVTLTGPTVCWGSFNQKLVAHARLLATSAEPDGSQGILARIDLQGPVTPHLFEGPCFLKAGQFALTGAVAAELSGRHGVNLALFGTKLDVALLAFNSDCVPVAYSIRFDGPAILTETDRQDPLALQLNDFSVIVDASRRPARIDMNGTLAGPCLAGGVTLSTLDDVQASAADNCPRQGIALLRSTDALALVSYQRDTAVAIDAGLDGTPDVTYANCHAPALLECLPGSCSGPRPEPKTIIAKVFDSTLGRCDLTADLNVNAADITGSILFGSLPAVPPTPDVPPPQPTATATPANTATVTASATGTPTVTLTPATPIEPTVGPTQPPTATPSSTETSTSTPPATSTRTRTATPTDTPTTTQTPTPPDCPASGAELWIDIDNQTNTLPVFVSLSGERIGADCRTQTLSTSYAVNVSCAGATLPCATLSGLAPGYWRHSIAVLAPATNQAQHRSGLVIADETPSRIGFRIFPTVLLVSTPADAGPGSLRRALETAPVLPKPLLIQFDPVVFPPDTPTAVLLLSKLPSLATDAVTIDGTDPTGATGNRVIDASSLPIGALAVTGARNTIIGLRLRNAGGNNRDVLSISGSRANGNVIEKTIVEGAATADGIGVDLRAGASFGDAVNLIRDCEVSGAADKGIKVTTGAYARVERSWVHHNLNGGIQATIGGHVEVWDSLVENNAGSTAQNGLVANGADDDINPTEVSELRSQGNVSRYNGANGLALRAWAIGESSDNYLAANASSGVRIYNDVGGPAFAIVEGTSAVCNQAHGAAVADDSFADFGGGLLGSAGSNAFAGNALSSSGKNFFNSAPAQISAINCQWEACGNADACDDDAIDRLDVGHHAGEVLFAPAQAPKLLPPPSVTTVVPASGRRGDLLRIFGSGFDAVAGNLVDGECLHPAEANRCDGLRGNCVRIGGVPAAVEAVTPTMLVARWPFTCVEPVALTVHGLRGTDEVTSEPVTLCVNATPTRPASAVDNDAQRRSRYER